MGTLKIKYTAVDKKTCEADGDTIQFTVKINGVKAWGRWRPYSCGNLVNGVWVNDLLVGSDEYVGIFTKDKTRNIRAEEQMFLPLSKQPKNLSFTGRWYDTSFLGKVFTDAITKAVESNSPLLTDSFKETFKIG